MRLLRRTSIVALIAGLAASTLAYGAEAPSAERLAALAPKADRVALERAVAAMRCAQAHGQGVDATRLTVIDYSLPSLEPRLWVFDLAQQRLLFEEHVAHGKNSGENYARAFSNTDGSLQTSLGLFLTGDTYQGANGYSLRLQGLEAGVNDRAMPRAIVIHGAPYVDPVAAKARGRLGRSWGCPALRTAVAAPLIDSIKHGNFVFSYYAGDARIAQAPLQTCPAGTTAALTSAATASVPAIVPAGAGARATTVAP